MVPKTTVSGKPTITCKGRWNNSSGVGRMLGISWPKPSIIVPPEDIKSVIISPWTLRCCNRIPIGIRK